MGERGFTLIELLIATALFVFVAQMAFNGLTSVVHQNDLMAQQTTQNRALMHTFALLRRDLEAAAPAGFGTSEDRPKSFRLIPQGFSVIRGGAQLLPNENRDSFVRVDWFVQDAKLVRRQHGSIPDDQPVLSQVKSLNIVFLTRANNAVPAGDILPEAFEVTVDHGELGLLRVVVTR